MKKSNEKESEKTLNQQPQHEEGVQYLKDDGEVYAMLSGVECRVCDLVWEAFNDVIPDGYRVAHIDGNKVNNRLDNLFLEKL
ncbi:MAG: HNH endonuclease [Muribaculaceae bacterium]|nr:HNH endonuclease [Muribaculaceae bacterium]